jgi:hypothetical protein
MSQAQAAALAAAFVSLSSLLDLHPGKAQMFGPDGAFRW